VASRDTITSFPTSGSPDCREQVRLAEALHKRARLTPAATYRPHSITHRSPSRPEDAAYDRKGRPSGQLQFHQSKHPVRIAAPGNGWGGTFAMAAEVDAWVRHTHRWQHTPDGPLQVIWFCPLYKQFALLREQLTTHIFGSLPRFIQGGHNGPHFVWPDGSKMFLGSYDTSWDHMQGIEPHLIAFDEQPPPALWREMQQRRRSSERLTRYICKATQTKGWGWMGEDIYRPWREYHIERGVTDEEEMMDQQLHPYYWLWPRGGIHDNPYVADEVIVEHEERAWPSKLERKVRLYGGFESFDSHCIFDGDALDWLRVRAKELDVEIGGSIRGGLVMVEPE
jgi:hypothetical protein